MKAVRYTTSGFFLESSTPIPIPSEGETLIKTRMAGICRTDLELTKGYMGYQGTLGHEFVGELGEQSPIGSVGTRVVGEINAGCEQCEMCKKGLQRHCPHRSVLGILKRDGCMGEWFALPHQNIIKVPDTIPDEEAVFSEPLAAALEIFEQIHIQPQQSVCVIGDGKLGLIITMLFAHRHEGEILLVGHHQKKLEIVQDRVKVKTEDQLESQNDKQWDIVVDATGHSSGLNLAMRLVCPRGIIILKSTMAQAEALDLTPLVIDEITVVGSRCGRMQPALDLLARHALPLDRLIEAIYPIDQAEEAWNRASTSGAKKVLLKFL